MFDIRQLFAAPAFQRMLQPAQDTAGVQNMLMAAAQQPEQRSQNMLTRDMGVAPGGFVPQTPAQGQAVDPVQTAAIPQQEFISPFYDGPPGGGVRPTGQVGAQQPGQQSSGGILDRLRSGINKEALNDIFAGWAAGGNDWQKSLALGGVAAAKGSAARGNIAGNAKWLMDRGYSENDAKLIAGNQDAFQQVLKNYTTPQDPMKQQKAALDLQKTQLEIERMRNPDTKPPTLVEMFDEKTGLPYKAQWNPEKGQYERVGGVKAASGMQVTTNPDGTVSITQGNLGAKALTEQQSKDTVYATRAEGALPLIDSMGNALTSLGESVGGQLPVAGNYLKSPEYQQAEQAGREFLAAILRKDTGAAITKQEMEEYGSVYLPRPGDSQEVLTQKQQSRSRALAALKAGMPAAAIMQQQNALSGGGNAVPEGVDPRLWKHMTPEERKLWQ